jgi:hypothetical protein
VPPAGANASELVKAKAANFDKEPDPTASLLSSASH